MLPDVAEFLEAVKRTIGRSCADMKLPCHDTQADPIIGVGEELDDLEEARRSVSHVS
jgi:hypothetical protein